MMTTNSSREKILAKLKKAPSQGLPDRSERPAQVDIQMAPSTMAGLLKEKLTKVGCQVVEAADREAVCHILDDFFKQEGITRALNSNDDVVKALKLGDWADQKGYRLRSIADFETPREYKDAVFLEAEAGITGVDFAAASTGSLVLEANRQQARLVSLAPINHIAIVPLSRVVPDHQSVVSRIFADGRRPSQVIWITGPSRTGDIESIINLGMHGPKTVMVILVQHMDV